jgi:hypothetical protein
MEELSDGPWSGVVVFEIRKVENTVPNLWLLVRRSPLLANRTELMPRLSACVLLFATLMVQALKPAGVEMDAEGVGIETVAGTETKISFNFTW